MLFQASKKVVRSLAYSATRYRVLLALVGSFAWVVMLPTSLHAQRTSEAYAYSPTEQYWIARWSQLRRVVETTKPAYKRWREEREKHIASGLSLPAFSERKPLKYEKLREVVDRQPAYIRWREREAELEADTKTGTALRVVPPSPQETLNYRGLRQIVLRNQKAKPPIPSTFGQSIHR